MLQVNVMSFMSQASSVQLNILFIRWSGSALSLLGLKLVLDHSDLLCCDFMTISLECLSEKLWVLLRQSSSWLTRLLDNSINLDSVFLFLNTLFDVEV